MKENAKQLQFFPRGSWLRTFFLCEAYCFSPSNIISPTSKSKHQVVSKIQTILRRYLFTLAHIHISYYERGQLGFGISQY
jgi:hypothetical protein